MATKAKNKEDKELLITMRERFHIMKEDDDENLREAINCMKFIHVTGEQWHQYQKDERRDRPCYEFNKLRINAKKITNHIRTNRPSAKLRGVDTDDKKQAEYREGIIRNIWNTSDGNTIMDNAAEYQVSAGMGAWRIVIETPDDAFDDDIKIKEIPNPFCLFNDPNAKDMLKRDADDWILTTRMSKKAYKENYPDAKPVDFEEHEFDNDSWSEEDDDDVRLAEFWYKVPVEKEILKLQD